MARNLLLLLFQFLFARSFLTTNFFLLPAHHRRGLFAATSDDGGRVSEVQPQAMAYDQTQGADFLDAASGVKSVLSAITKAATAPATPTHSSTTTSTSTSTSTPAPTATPPVPVNKKFTKKITPNEGESLEDYRKAVFGVLNAGSSGSAGEFGGRELLELILRKWGAAYDVQLRKSAPFGEASGNLYVNLMWRYFGQKSFGKTEREYLEHLEAVARYIKAMDRVEHFKDKVKESRKRPNGYFGYAVSFPLDVPPDSADTFFGSIDDMESNPNQ